MTVGRKQIADKTDNKATLSVFMCISKRNAREGMLALSSLLTHSKAPFDICVFADGLESAQKESFYAFASEATNVRIVNGRLYDRKGIQKEWYGLFYLPELMADHDKVLVLSPDTIVCEDISELWDIDINHYVLAAAKYLFNELTYRYTKNIIGKWNGEYVDTSIMLINRKRFAKERNRLFFMIEKTPQKSLFRDVVINDAFSGKVFILSPRWNCPYEPVFSDSRNEFLMPQDQKLYDESRVRPLIMNYGGIHKPWNYPEYPESRYYFNSLEYLPTQKTKQFFFTILTTSYNCGKYLTHYFESLINQSIGFERNIQIVFIDDGSTDDTEQICRTYQERFPDNIMYEKQQHSGISAGRNKALCLAKDFGTSGSDGTYLYFLDADDYLTEDFFEKVYDAVNAMEDISVFAVPVTYIEGERETRLRKQHGREPFCPLNLYIDYGIGINNLSSFIFPSTAHFLFDEKVQPREAEIDFIRRHLKDEQEIGWVNHISLLARVREDQDSLLWDIFTDLEKITHYYQNFWQKIIEDEIAEKSQIPYYIQYSFVEEIVCFISRNAKADQFWNVIYPVLTMIEDTVIIDALGMQDMSRILFVLGKKYGNIPALRPIEDDVEIVCGNTAVGRASYQSVLLHFVKIENDHLIIEGESSVPSSFGKESAVVSVEINGDIKQADMLERESNKYLLGECYEYGSAFSFEYPLQQEEPLRIRFAYRVGDHTVFYHTIIGLRFSPISNEVLEQYAIRDGYALFLQGDSLFCHAVDEKEKEDLEARYINILRNTNDQEAIRAARFRKHFFFLREKKKKQIWLFFDRIDKADDNGEAMFRYIVDQKLPDVDAYFVIGKNCSDYHRLEQIGKVIPANSIKHRLLFAMADYVLTSQANGFVENPFGKGEKYYRDLLHTPKVIFLQHGVTKDDQTRWLNRFQQDFTAIVTSSKRETDSILNEPYFYQEKQIWLTGMPRFDLLYHAEQKYILIMPTWRKSLMEQRWNEQTGAYRWEPYDGFSESDYCRKYRSLMNNQKLQSACKRYGYTLVFMTHPIVQPYQDQFEIPENVKTFSYDTNWRELFAWSDLMVTDYSSVAFDFAYLRKPIIYYQFDRDTFFEGHTYSEGYFHYDADGFGEIAEQEEELVILLEQYMQENCRLKPIYEERINQFYEYKDTKNCARILECMKKMRN